MGKGRGGEQRGEERRRGRGWREGTGGDGRRVEGGVERREEGKRGKERGCVEGGGGRWPEEGAKRRFTATWREEGFKIGRRFVVAVADGDGMVWCWWDGILQEGSWRRTQGRSDEGRHIMAGFRKVSGTAVNAATASTSSKGLGVDGGPGQRCPEARLRYISSNTDAAALSEAALSLVTAYDQHAATPSHPNALPHSLYI